MAKVTAKSKSKPAAATAKKRNGKVVAPAAAKRKSRPTGSSRPAASAEPSKCHTPKAGQSGAASTACASPAGSAGAKSATAAAGSAGSGALFDAMLQMISMLPSRANASKEMTAQVVSRFLKDDEGKPTPLAVVAHAIFTSGIPALHSVNLASQIVSDLTQASAEMGGDVIFLSKEHPPVWAPVAEEGVIEVGNAMAHASARYH